MFINNDRHGEIIVKIIRPIDFDEDSPLDSFMSTIQFDDFTKYSCKDADLITRDRPIKKFK